MPGYSLNRMEKIKSRKTISFLFKEGQRITSGDLRACYYFLPDHEGELKVGFSVGTKNFKKAVDRNRIKRVMRESFRLQKPISESLRNRGSLKVFFVYSGRELPAFSAIYDSMKMLLERINIAESTTDQVPK